MDIVKDVKKAFSGRGRGACNKYNIVFGAGFTDVIIEGIIVFRIPDAARVIDFNAIIDAVPALMRKVDFSIETYITDARPATVTDKLFAYNHGGKQSTLRAFDTVNGGRCYVNTDLLTMVEKYTGGYALTYAAGVKRGAPVIVNQYGNFAALVLPVNYHETETQTA